MQVLKKNLVFLAIPAFAIFLISVVFFSLNFNSLPEEVILQFVSAEGVKTFGSRGDLIGILAISGLILTMNLILAETLFYRDRVLTLIFLASNLILSIITLIIIPLIISIN